MSRESPPARFASANEAVTEGLNLLEEREEAERAKIQWLEAAIQEARDDLDRTNAELPHE